MASAVSCPHFIHMLLNQTELTFPQLNIQDNITIVQTDLVKVWTYYQTHFLGIFIHFLSKLDSIFYKKSQLVSNQIQASHNSLLQIALSNMSATLSQYVTVLKNQTEKEYDQLCAPAKRIQTECHYPAACSKLTPTFDAIFYCYLKQTLSYLVDTILFLDSPCHNTQLASAVSCPHFIHMLLNQTGLTFPQLSIQDNITIAQTDLVKIALSNMSATLRKYVTVLENQTEKEYDHLCAPAKRIPTKCHYPAACSKFTPISDAIFYCYLKQTLSYLFDTILFLDSPIFSNIKQNVEVDDSLLLPDDVPITKQRWFTIITLHALHENINHIQNTLESFM
ncbi:Hypothetical predicted protein [Octopus vulgaris]|uniref:Uncharacterized protein n=1 Tax=Octopus vulgaris TaxID=6645 RepID=A0AA36AZ34_OCTVU|nr:Hypothetical predicted protein [Octopus vulgaris]